MGFFGDLVTLLVMEACKLWVSLYRELGKAVFYMEDYIGFAFDRTHIDAIFDFARNLAISLVILKVLKKGFFTYILWRDGDPDTPVQQSVINMVLAVIVAIGFPTLYDWYVDVSLYIIEFISTATFDMMELEDWPTIMDTFIDMSGIFALIMLIYIIMLFVLYLQFLKRSAELLILRVGFPLACLGLLDSDNGVFTSTVKVFLQVSLTTIVQLFFMQLSMTIFIKMQTELYNPFLCIACLMAAFATPKMLQFILLQTGSGGGPMSTASQAAHIFSYVKAAGGGGK